MMKQGKTKWMIVGAVVLVVAAGVAWEYQYRPPKATGDPSVLPPLSEISLNKLPDGFLLYLVLGTSPKVVSGSSKPIPNSTMRVVSVQLTVSESTSDIYQMYKAYFEKNGWTLLPVEANPATPVLFAKKGSDRVNMNFSANGTGATVSMTQMIRTYAGTGGK